MPRKKAVVESNVVVAEVSVDKLYDLCVTQFGLLHEMVTAIDKRCGELDVKLQAVVDAGSGGGGGGGAGPFVKIEDKIDFLNKSKNNVIDESILSFVLRCAEVREDHVVAILKGNATIYEIISQCIAVLYVDSSQDFLFAFGFQKYVLYYWSAEKMTWDKMDRVMLKSLFEIIQKKLIGVYTKMIQSKSDAMMGIDIVDNGDKLFVDNFDKKYTDFRKSVFLLMLEGWWVRVFGGYVVEGFVLLFFVSVFLFGIIIISM